MLVHQVQKTTGMLLLTAADMCSLATATDDREEQLSEVEQSYSFKQLADGPLVTYQFFTLAGLPQIAGDKSFTFIIHICCCIISFYHASRHCRSKGRKRNAPI